MVAWRVQEVAAGLKKPSTIMNRNTLHLLAGKSFAGLTELGVALAVVHCTPAQLTGLITDAGTKRQLFKTARAVKTQAFLDLRTAREEVDTFCEQARDYLKPALGTFWSGFWAAIGFE